MAFITGPALPSAAAPARTRRRTPATPVCTAAGSRRTSTSTNTSASTSTSTSAGNARSPAHAQAVSRRDVLLSLAATALAAGAAAPRPAHAKNGEGLERAFSKVLFPKQGFNAPDAVQPGAAAVDQAVLSTAAAKAALTKLRGYDAAVADLYASFKADPQVELTPGLSKLFSISELRDALNVVNEAVDEDAQIATDKVVRGIIQDIGELQNAAVLKQGVPRTPKKIDRTDDWFKKLTSDFTRLLSFYG